MNLLKKVFVSKSLLNIKNLIRIFIERIYFEMISTKDNVKESKNEKDTFRILLRKNVFSYLTIPINLNNNPKLYCFFSYHTLEVLISILFWYFNSIGITALNKYLFDVAGFNLPLLVAFVNFSCVSIGLVLVNGCIVSFN
jgi:hypothetical protein